MSYRKKCFKIYIHVAKICPHINFDWAEEHRRASFPNLEDITIKNMTPHIIFSSTGTVYVVK